MFFRRLFRKTSKVAEPAAQHGDGWRNPMLHAGDRQEPPELLRRPEPEAADDPAPVAPPIATPEARPAPAEREATVVPTGSALDIYTQHFGLTERPFSLVPDPEFLYWSDLHRRAYSMLEYGIMTRSPITLITGDVGAGKTTLLHHLLKSVQGNVRIGLISNAQGDRGDVLRWVMVSLGQEVPKDIPYVDLFARFQDFLIEEYAAGRRVILIFDEAQNLSREALEELRMFTNINSNKDELLQLILVGQPELRDLIARPDLKQFAQRIASNYHLNAMTSESVGDYIFHRLRIAGASREIFEPEAIRLIFEATGGVPRLVNQLCDLAMVYTFTADLDTVNETTVRQVLNEGVFFGGGIQKYPALPLNRDQRLSGVME